MQTETTRPIRDIDADIAVVTREATDYDKETRRLRTEVSAARNAGEAEINQRLYALKAELLAARDAEALAAPHEWEGKKVTRIERRRARPWSQTFTETQLFGAVETVTSQTVFPANISYKPSVGQPIVRLLKKDGSAGLKIETLARGSFQDQWKLA